METQHPHTLFENFIKYVNNKVTLKRFFCYAQLKVTIVLSCSADCLILVCSSSLYLNHVNQSDSTTLKSCLVWCYTLLWMFSISVLLDASCVNGCQKLTSHWSLQIKFWPLTECKIKFICACWTFNFKIMAINSEALFWDLGNGSLSETRASWVFNNVQQWTCITGEFWHVSAWRFSPQLSFH